MREESCYSESKGSPSSPHRVQLRGKCTSWFAQQDQCAGNEALQHSNTKHGFLNDTLEIIRSILKPFAEPPPERPEIVTDNPSTSFAAQNMFDTLPRLDVTDDEDEEPVIHTAKVPEIVKDFPKDVAFEADKSGDVLMVICCLFQDFLELRLTVRCNWYTAVSDTSPMSDMMTAALLTQGANEIIHILVRDLQEQFPNITSMKEIMVLLLGSETSN